MRRLTLALAALASLALSAWAGGSEDSGFPVKTLTTRSRLALPRLRVPVGPDRPLAIRGRREKVAFEEVEGALRADATSAEGFETEIRPGQPVTVELDPVADGEPPPVRKLVFVAGDTGAGEPAWSVVSLDALVGTIGSERVLFVDHDADGTFLTPHSDYIVRQKGGDVFPVHSTVVLGRRVYRVVYYEDARRVDAAPNEEFVDPEIFPNWAGVAAGLAHLNAIRSRMNLLPVALNRKASRDTMMHVRYLARNGGNGHVEERGKPGYTRAGMKAGLNAIGSLNIGGIPATIEGHLASLLHRMELIDATVQEIGIASDSSRVWIHTECAAKRTWDGQGPVIFPGPNRAWNLGTYSGENPDPRPEGENRTSGLPVTVAWFGKEKIREVKMELKGSRGRIKCWKNDAERTELKTNHPHLRAVIMPNS
ncbi:MAG: CAP domain-containing protein, partial [Planctomycetota bacterium]